MRGKTQASFISRMLALSINLLWSPHRRSWTRYAYIIGVRVYAWVGVRFTGKSLAIQSRRIAQGRDTALRAPVDLHRELYFSIRSEHNLYFNRSARRISAARKTWADSPFKQRQRLVEHATLFPLFPKTFSVLSVFLRVTILPRDRSIIAADVDFKPSPEESCLVAVE